jgi:hypothetical protein
MNCNCENIDFLSYRVSKRTDRRFSSIAQHNIDPDFVPKTVLQFSVKKNKLSESENENGCKAIGN